MALLYYVLSFLEVALLIMSVSSGIVVSVLVRRQLEAFAGECVLAGQVIWYSHTHFELSPSDVPRCTYIIAVQAVAAAVAFTYGLYRVIAMCSERLDFPVMRVICIPVYSIMTVLTLAEAAILSHGLNEICGGFQGLNVVTTNYECATFQLVDWHIYDGGGFYDDYSKAEISGWISFVAWVSLVAIGVLHCLSDRPDNAFPSPNNAK
ncbi:uncharacterized protein LOC119727200 [Patiria miniata]|uniref:Uncharacterized protein n=1 Tax=Patiria miniata TaxID=46514 RepID=A0A913ZTA5_PATMI|nr:uncharacterized protein LOC119727200 [Patiria miniata]